MEYNIEFYKTYNIEADNADDAIKIASRKFNFHA